MRLLVTRPEPDASALARRLGAAGHEAIAAPLMTVRFMGDVPDLAGVQALLFTSANGVRAFAHVAGRVPPLPAFAVGAATAKALGDAGFIDIRTADGDVVALAALVSDTLDPTAGALLHVAGTVTAGDLAGDLGAQGFEVRRAVLYEATAAEALPDAARAALESGSADGVLLFSPRTARLYAELVAAAGLGDAAVDVTAYCLSPAVADALQAALGAPVKVAAQPETESLIALL